MNQPSLKEVAPSNLMPVPELAGIQETGNVLRQELRLEDKILMISNCLSYSIYEANVYWQRNAIYLTINSIMAGALAALFKDLPSVPVLCFGIFGLFFNWNWVHVNKYSKFLAERWREDARALAESSPELSNYMRALVRNPRIDVPSGKRPSDVMNNLSSSFRVIWGIVTVYGVYLVGPGSLKLAFGAAQTFGKWVGII